MNPRERQDLRLRNAVDPCRRSTRCDDRRAGALPIYQTTAYAFDDADHAGRPVQPADCGLHLLRLTNPTNAALEPGSRPWKAGAAARHLVRPRRAGAGAVPADDRAPRSSPSRLYGGSLQQMRNTYPKFGWKAAIVDADQPENFKRAASEKHRAFFIESLANPGGVVSDIEAIARIAEAVGVPLLVDNTLATPFLCRPIDYGATLIVHSTTKFLSGTGTSMGGAVVDSGKFDWTRGGRFPSLAGPEPAYHGLNFRDVRRHGLHLPQPRRRPARPSDPARRRSILDHHARHGDARPAHWSAIAPTRSPSRASSRPTRRSRGSTTPACRQQVLRAGSKYLPKGAGSVFTFGVKAATTSA